MNSAQTIARHYRQGVSSIQPRLAGQGLPWLAERRDTALRAFEALPFPERRMEDWRYTSVDKLLDHRFEPVAPGSEHLRNRSVEQLLPEDLQTCRLVFADGRFVPSLSDRGELPADVIIGSLHDALRHQPDRVAPWLGRVARPDLHSFTAMNSAEMNDGLFVYIPDDCQLEQPVEVLYLTAGRDDAIVVQPRNLVVLGQGARATLIERYAGAGRPLYFNNGLSEVVLGQKARLKHYRLQQESRDAYHLHADFVQQAAQSDYTSTRFMLGGVWSRNETAINFVGEGAVAHLAGLFTVGDRQLNDIHLNIEHAVPGCTSASDFRGLLYGRGRGVFDGRIAVAAQAQGTEAHLNNANLLLSRDAEVDTKPRLEIYADAVKCSHGATVGELDELQLFYLRSRGIPASQARRMLCLGFADEILARCDIGPLRSMVERELATALAAGDTPQHAQEQ